MVASKLRPPRAAGVPCPLRFEVKQETHEFRFRKKPKGQGPWEYHLVGSGGRLKPEQNRMLSLKCRPDRVGSEMNKDRPWLTLSRQPVHERGIFISVCLTSGKQRALSVDAEMTYDGDAMSYDCQQVWTFIVADVADGGLVRKTDPREPNGGPLIAMRNMLKASYAVIDDDVGPFPQGRIVSIELPAVLTTLDSAGNRIPNPLKSDIAVVGKIAALIRATPNAWSVPAMVLTSRRHREQCLQEDHETNRDSGILNLVTVCPLVHVSGLVAKQRYLIKDSRGMVWTPLTQCLLSVDYRAMVGDRAQRVTDLDDEVAPELRVQIVQEILGFLETAS